MTTRTFSRLLPILTFSWLSLCAHTGARAAENLTVPTCGVDEGQQPQRIVADPDGKHWREYPSMDKVPALTNDAGQFAKYWVGAEDKALITIGAYGEDFSSYAHYCFGKAGELLSLRYELRTAWGWGFREGCTVVNGILKTDMAEFFETEGNKRIAKPAQASNIAGALKPHIYKQVSQLPFAKFLAK